MTDSQGNDALKCFFPAVKAKGSFQGEANKPESVFILISALKG